MYEFDEDRRVEAVAPGRYQGNVSARWNVGPIPNGGYVLAVAMAALEAEFDGLDPLTVTAHYLRPAAPGPFAAEVEVIKRGRSYSTAMVRLLQDAREVVRVLATYGTLHESAGPEFVAATPPAAPRERCVPWATPGTGPGFAIAERFAIAFDPEDAERLQGGNGGRAELRGWLRFADRRPPDTACLGLIADAFPPPVFQVTPRGWVPTIELTVHVRARPSTEWLNCGFRTRFLSGGLLEEDGEIWDESGRLVALSRQLAGAPRMST